MIIRANIEIDAALISEPVNDFVMAETGGEVERGTTFLGLSLDIGMMREQQLHYLGMSILTGKLAADQLIKELKKT